VDSQVFIILSIDYSSLFTTHYSPQKFALIKI